MLHTLKDLDILRFRGGQAGKQSQNRGRQVRQSYHLLEGTDLCANHLSATVSQYRGRNQSHIKRVLNAKSYEVPSILATNIRNLSNTVDELYQVATHNKTDVICITETWLSQLVPDSAVSQPGFLLLRNDRKNQSGGGVHIKENIPCKQLVESIWVQLRPHSLLQNISIILLGVVYHSTANGEAENVTLLDHIQKNMDSYLSKHPNAMVILTGLRSDSISRPNHLMQIVQFNTRDY